MPITRAKATALLNQREMALYDDSRANAIRELNEKALSVRISRARDLRDRARDLVQRQKLSSRDKTGNKRGASGIANQRSKDKVELTTDILRRFEAQLDKVADANTGTGTGKKAAKKNAKKAAKTPAKTPARKSAGRRADRRDARKATRDATRSAKAAKPAAKKSPARKTAAGKTTKTTKTATRKTAARKTKSAATQGAVAKKASTKTTDKKRSAVAKPASARKATAAKAPARRTSATKAARKKAGKSARNAATTKPLTPRQALKRTQSLLKAKQERDRAPKSWETLQAGGGTPNQSGYQSNAAERRAQELHAGEARMPAIKGSISTRDRINQGKRDHRNGN